MIDSADADLPDGTTMNGDQLLQRHIRDLVPAIPIQPHRATRYDHIIRYQLRGDMSRRPNGRPTKNPTLHDKRLCLHTPSSETGVPLNRLIGSRELLLQLLIPGRVIVFPGEAIFRSSSVRDLMSSSGRDDMLRSIEYQERSRQG